MKVCIPVFFLKKFFIFFKKIIFKLKHSKKVLFFFNILIILKKKPLPLPIREFFPFCDIGKFLLIKNHTFTLFFFFTKYFNFFFKNFRYIPSNKVDLENFKTEGNLDLSFHSTPELFLFLKETGNFVSVIFLLLTIQKTRFKILMKI